MAHQDGMDYRLAAQRSLKCFGNHPGRLQKGGDSRLQGPRAAGGLPAHEVDPRGVSDTADNHGAARPHRCGGDRRRSGNMDVVHHSPAAAEVKWLLRKLRRAQLRRPGWFAYSGPSRLLPLAGPKGHLVVYVGSDVPQVDRSAGVPARASLTFLTSLLVSGVPWQSWPRARWPVHPVESSVGLAMVEGCPPR